MNDVLSFHTDLLSQQQELDFLEQPFMLDFGDIPLFSPERSLEWPFSLWQCGLWPESREIMELAAVIQIIHPSGFQHPLCSLLARVGHVGITVGVWP